MTDLLRKAFEEASKLQSSEQDAVARWLLEELASERRWDDAFARSQNGLSSLAAEALEDHRRGRTRPLDPESM
jgi:hypothetical protein